MNDVNERLSRLSPDRRALIERALTERSPGGRPGSAPETRAVRKPKFSVFFFSADLQVAGDRSIYDLFYDAVDAAERGGLHAVWVPERHFHRFGGPYPNPAILAAAAAARTSRILLRAGSVVLPLHDALTVAEQWAAVDQLSNGRVGVSFASGWNPVDFVLRPESYGDRKLGLATQIAEVRRLWKGEPVQRRGPDGKIVDVRVFPGPRQSEIPIWLTSSSSVETWRRAGELGANVLTALLEQSIEQAAEHIGVYRKELARFGHDPDKREVTLMLHSFVGLDEAHARSAVQAPLRSYLREHLGMYEEYARQQGIDPDSVSAATRDALVTFAFERYFKYNGFFGSIEECASRAQKFAEIGVTEIANLIDFGVEHDAAVGSVERLGELARRFAI